MLTKIIYALLAVAILSGIYLTFFGQEAEAPTGEENTAELNGEALPPAVDEVEGADESEDESESGMMMEAETEASIGSDVGMELPIMDTDGTVREFDVDGFNFGYSVQEIRVQQGDTVTINLTSSDGFHDWVVDELGVATSKINTGGATSVTFVADTAGTFEYYCSVGSHRANGMVGTLIVE